MQIYLAGPINHVNLKESSEWRQWAEKLLKNYRVVNPFYHMAYQGDQMVLLENKELVQSDYLLVNGEHLIDRSIGTLMEIGIAAHCQIPIVMFGAGRKEKEHPFLKHYVTYFADDLEDACRYIQMDIRARAAMPQRYAATFICMNCGHAWLEEEVYLKERSLFLDKSMTIPLDYQSCPNCHEEKQIQVTLTDDDSHIWHNVLYFENLV